MACIEVTGLAGSVGTYINVGLDIYAVPTWLLGRGIWQVVGH
jgi:hypothetical protein